MRAAGNSTLPMILRDRRERPEHRARRLVRVRRPGAAEPWAWPARRGRTVIARGVFAAWVASRRSTGASRGCGCGASCWHWQTNWTILKIGIPSCAQWLVRMLSYLYMLRFLAEAAPKAAGEVPAPASPRRRRRSASGFGSTRWRCSAASGGGPRRRPSWGRTWARGLPDRAVPGHVDRARPEHDDDAAASRAPTCCFADPLLASWASTCRRT